MKNKIRISSALIPLFLIGIFLAPTNAFAVRELVIDLPAPFAVAEEAEDVIAAGCTEVESEIDMNLTLQTRFYVTWDPTDIRVQPSDTGGINNLYFCNRASYAKLTPLTESLQQPFKTIAWILNNILTLIGQVGVSAMRYAAQLLGFVLSENRFVQHPYVQQGWPFIQGIANIGFIIALLFIATLVTLQPIIGEKQGGIKRLLPRLILAALLINFSLLIGAILIDASRLLIAIFVNVNGPIANWYDFSRQLLEKSNLLTGIFDSTTGKFDPPTAGYSWRVTFHIAQSVILIWGMAIGMLYVSVNLLIRHIALILLLVFSPIAYLAVALPNTDGVAKKWWEEFLKWVFYGPIVLFMLVLISKLGDAFNVKSADQTFASALQVGITVALFIISAKVGKSLGSTAAGAVIGYAENATKRTGRFIYKNPVASAAIAGSIATGGAGLLAAGAGAAAAGTGAFFAGKGISRGTKSVQDFLGARRASIAKKDKDKEEARKKNSFGTRLGQQIYDPEATAQKQAAVAASKANRTGAYKGADLRSTPDLSAAKLANGNFSSNLDDKLLGRLTLSGNNEQKAGLAAGIASSKGLEKAQITAVLKNTNPAGDTTVLKSLVNNTAIVEEMDDSQRAEIIKISNDSGDKDIAKDLFAAMRRIQDKKDKDAQAAAKTKS